MLSTVMQRAAAGNLVTIPPIFPSSSWRNDRYLIPPIGTFQFGMYIPTSADSSINRGSATMESSEARFKKTYDLANIYYSTASTTSSVTALMSRINDHLTAGRIPRVDFNFGPYVSKSNTISATTATYWRDVASGNYDNDYTADDGTSLRGIRYVLNRVLAVHQRLIVTLHHEADLKGETGGYNDQWYGNEADFRAMWQHIVILARTLVSQNNLLKEPVWFFNMAYDPKPGNTDTNKRKWGDTLTDIGSDGMYPGHNFVDRVGCDPYNGAAWSGHGNTWRSFGGTVNQFGFKDWWMSNFATGGARTQALANSGQGVYKPAMLGEFGTMERWASYTYSGSSGDGRDWLVGFKDFVSPGGGAYTTVSDNETGTRDASKPWLLAAIYFGRDYPSGPGSMYNDLSTATTSPQWGINPESPQKWAGLGDIAGASVFQTSAVDVNQKIPGEILDLVPWYLTLPVGPSTNPANPIDIYQPQLNSYSDIYFYVGPNNRVHYRALAQGATTSSASGSTRCELREMDGQLVSDKASWGFNDGRTHELTVTLSADMPSMSVRKEVIVAQIHDETGTPPIYISINFDAIGNPVKAFINGPSESTPLLASYTPGSEITIRIRVNGSRCQLFAAAGSVTALPLSPNFDYPSTNFMSQTTGCYFKAGCYPKQKISDDGSGETIVQHSYLTLINRAST